MNKAAVAAGVAFAVTIFAPLGAGAAGIDGTGSIPTCPVSGNLKLKPALVNGGSEPGTLKLSTKSAGPCSGGTGAGATIESYKLKGSGTAANNACGDLEGTESSDLTLTFKWKVAKGSGKLNASTATFAMLPGALSPEGNQTFELDGTITSGSFAGTPLTAHIESQETAASLLAGCDAKGIKKILFGKDDQTSSCVNGPDLVAAITRQVTTTDANDVPHLEVQILTVTASPFQASATDLDTTASGTVLESLSSSCALSDGNYRCRHTAFYVSSGACQWSGDYSMALSYACSPTNTCDLCSGQTTVDFTLNTENFCDVSTVFCAEDLSCSATTAPSSSGGVPCCSATYNPLISCLTAQCASDCATVIDGEGGVLAGSPCETCAVMNCEETLNACSADTQVCPVD